jgi:hypothetical protein
MTVQTSPSTAAQLLAKGLRPKLAPANDKDYRDLLALYQADDAMRTLCQQIATGMGLAILSVCERGLVLVASDADSRFAYRLSDLRSHLSADEKAIIVLVHTTIAAQFYPTAECLETERAAPPITERSVLEALKDQCRQLSLQGPAQTQGLPRELEAGWKAVLSKPESRPEDKRRTPGTLEGIIAIVFRKLNESGLVRLDESDAANLRYTANYKLTVQLRESTSQLYVVAQKALAAASRVAALAAAAAPSEALPGATLDSLAVSQN